MNVKDRFRKRWLGSLGWAGGRPDMVGQPVIHTAQDAEENRQSQQEAVRDKVYAVGDKPPKRKTGR